MLPRKCNWVKLNGERVPRPKDGAPLSTSTTWDASNSRHSICINWCSTWKLEPPPFGFLSRVHLWALDVNWEPVGCINRNLVLNRIKKKTSKNELDQQSWVLLAEGIILPWPENLSHPGLDFQPVCIYGRWTSSQNQLVARSTAFARKASTCRLPPTNNCAVTTRIAFPFPRHHSAGLLVAPSSKTPLIYGSSNQPLLEEYRIAQTQFRLKKTSSSVICQRHSQS